MGPATTRPRPGSTSEVPAAAMAARVAPTAVPIAPPTPAPSDIFDPAFEPFSVERGKSRVRVWSDIMTLISLGRKPRAISAS
jgi:hypothetical protein